MPTHGTLIGDLNGAYTKCRPIFFGGKEMLSSTLVAARLARFSLLCLMSVALPGCKPTAPPEPPPDLLKTQREALEKAKALEGQLQQQLQDRMNAAENSQKLSQA